MNLPTGRAAQNKYQIRINRAIDYILNHYDEKLTLDLISEIACLSKYYFHRLFTAMTGETFKVFLQRIRLEKSIYMLTNDMNKSITAIALDCGFSCSQNYAKVFKSYYGIVPSDIRKEYHWDKLRIKIENLPKQKKEQLPPAEACLIDIYYNKHQLSFEKILKRQVAPQVAIANLPDMRVAYIRSRGPYTWNKIGPSFLALYKWAASKELINEHSIMLSVIRNAPFMTAEDKLLHDACLTVPDSVKEDRWVNIQTLPGGKFAIYHCKMTSDRIDEAWIDFVSNWLIFSDYQPNGRPPYQIQRHDFVTPHLKHHNLDLCLPIKSLYE